MSMSVKCPGCEKQLKVPDELVGHTVKCPSCQTKFTATGNDRMEPAETGVSKRPGSVSPPPPPEPEWSEPELTDDEEDEGYDREPRRKRKRRKKRSPRRAAEAL